MASDIGLNQPPPYLDVDLFGTDLPLREALAANGAGAEAEQVRQFGRRWGAASMFELARLADIHPPKLDGDVVQFHPAYHSLKEEPRFQAILRQVGLALPSRGRGLTAVP